MNRGMALSAREGLFWLSVWFSVGCLVGWRAGLHAPPGPGSPVTITIAVSKPEQVEPVAKGLRRGLPELAGLGVGR